MEAAGVVEIGLSRAEFWALTPRQFQNLWERYQDREIRHDRRTALLAAMYRNAHLRSGEAPFTIEHFAPSRGASTPAAASQHVDAQLAQLRMAHIGAEAKHQGGEWSKLSDEELAKLRMDPTSYMVRN
jgi:hypothetical protein